MKVILLQDVARIGKRHAEVTVPDGYALNQLIPKKMALPATDQNRQRLARTMAAKSASSASAAADFSTAIAQLGAEPLTILVTANEHGHLFQAVHVSDVVAAAAAKGVTLAPVWVQLPAEPIKALGEVRITLVHETTTHELLVIIAPK